MQSSKCGFLTRKPPHPGNETCPEVRGWYALAIQLCMRDRRIKGSSELERAM